MLLNRNFLSPHVPQWMCPVLRIRRGDSSPRSALGKSDCLMAKCMDFISMTLGVSQQLKDGIEENEIMF